MIGAAPASTSLVTPTKTCDTVVTGHGMMPGSEFWHHTRTCGTRNQNTVGIPAPVLFPR